ncbi:hypothetical protein B0H13DRAFT_2311820 [Mycena leptocephala]|nr:hypothetical protein B0H13DRAFT_2311820 [Mycena leptocephala]
MSGANCANERGQECQIMTAHPRAKIYRQGVIDPEPDVYTLKLGTVEEILSAQEKTALRFDGVDKYHLKPIHGGTALQCDLFTSEKLEDEAKPNVIHSALAGESKPLEVARQRAADAAEAKPLFDKALLLFLGEVVKGPEKKWPTCKTARQVRDHFKALEDAVQKMHDMGWNKSGGGYMVPFVYKDSIRGDYDFKGTDFSKEILGNAVHIKHAAAGTDRQTMNKELLKHCPKATAWFANPDDDELGEKFNDMDAIDFRKRLEKKKAGFIKKKAQQKREMAEARAKAVEEAKKKKRKQPDSDDSDAAAAADSSGSETDSDAVGPSQKKRLRRKKAVLDSSDLDEPKK